MDVKGITVAQEKGEIKEWKESGKQRERNGRKGKQKGMKGKEERIKLTIPVKV